MMEEIHTKSLDDVKANILNLTKRIFVTEARAQKAQWAQRLELGTHDEKASPSSLLPSPPLDQPPSSPPHIPSFEPYTITTTIAPLSPPSSPHVVAPCLSAINYQLWEENFLNSAAIPLSQPSQALDHHYQQSLPFGLLKL